MNEQLGVPSDYPKEPELADATTKEDVSSPEGKPEPERKSELIPEKLLEICRDPRVLAWFANGGEKILLAEDTTVRPGYDADTFEQHSLTLLADTSNTDAEGSVLLRINDDDQGTFRIMHDTVVPLSGESVSDIFTGNVFPAGLEPDELKSRVERYLSFTPLNGLSAEEQEKVLATWDQLIDDEMFLIHMAVETKGNDFYFRDLQKIPSRPNTIDPNHARIMAAHGLRVISDQEFQQNRVAYVKDAVAKRLEQLAQDKRMVEEIKLRWQNLSPELDIRSVESVDIKKLPSHTTQGSFEISPDWYLSGTKKHLVDIEKQLPEYEASLQTLSDWAEAQSQSVEAEKNPTTAISEQSKNSPSWLKSLVERVFVKK